MGSHGIFSLPGGSEHLHVGIRNRSPLCCCDKAKLQLRYVDETFVIWNHGEEQLENFLSFLKGINSNINFTREK